MGVCMKQMNNEIIYPRSEEEVLLILATAKKEGHLLEIIFDEFVKKPFSMPVLWVPGIFLRAEKRRAGRTSGSVYSSCIAICYGWGLESGKSICTVYGEDTAAGENGYI